MTLPKMSEQSRDKYIRNRYNKKRVSGTSCLSLYLFLMMKAKVCSVTLLLSTLYHLMLFLKLQVSSLILGYLRKCHLSSRLLFSASASYVVYLLWDQ